MMTRTTTHGIIIIGCGSFYLRKKVQPIKAINNFETRTKAEQRRKNQKERSDLLLSMDLPFAKPPDTFEEMSVEYNRQRTVIGQGAVSVLAKFAYQMSQIAKHPIKAGILEPLKDGKTGKIKNYIIY